MAENHFTLFYAWQSDRPNTDNRNFIENAAKKALKGLIADGEVQGAPRLDKDTQDVPGMPDIANTILEKIDHASAFLADLTFIGDTQPEDGQPGRLIPNPNVMLELGYAVKRLHWDRIICVMNCHYGKQNDLPFDLRGRRWPVTYELAPNTDGTASILTRN